jgi:hypothetical protein
MKPEVRKIGFGLAAATLLLVPGGSLLLFGVWIVNRLRGKTCRHIDGYGSLVVDGHCMLCYAKVKRRQ